eukprot:CAMPEP_0197472616 /NCGR_PEP_ID=MMETSP1309-20131121/3833_1 /TAXON_ID=464262 /ORGANISM="Genus nov. species nov., Strain RCC998" /LENGTH=103 /DNA_ID=CAMNT_0043011265 /DNA_START=130 /DNA_END=438 /DNA_ORIENTATION=-
MKSDSKLDQLCDFTEQEKTVKKFRKFQNEVSPSSTFKVDDNWRMVPMKYLYPQNFRISGLTRQAKCDEGDSKPIYQISIPRKIVEESKFRLVPSNQNPYNSFS